jgi:hypothetical protein
VQYVVGKINDLILLEFSFLGFILKYRRRPPTLAALPKSASGPFPRIAADLVLESEDVDELVSLTTQLFSDHRRPRRDGGRDQMILFSGSSSNPDGHHEPYSSNK